MLISQSIHVALDKLFNFFGPSFPHLCFCLFFLKWKSLSLSYSLRPHGLYSPRNSPGQNTGVGGHSLLQGIFPTQGSNPVSCIAGGFFTVWATREAQLSYQGSIQVQSWEIVYSRNLSISSRLSTSLVYSYLSWSHESLYFCDVNCNFSFFIPDFIDLRPLFLGGRVLHNFLFLFIFSYF